jgi:hypothetical protein
MGGWYAITSNCSRQLYGRLRRRLLQRFGVDGKMVLAGTFLALRRHTLVRVVARFFSQFPEVRLPGLLVEAGPGGVAFGQPRLVFLGCATGLAATSAMSML